MANNNRLGFPPMIHLCGLWKKKDIHGQDFFSGALGNSRIFVFTNSRKKTESDPDLFLSLGQRIDTSDSDNHKKEITEKKEG